MTEGLVLSEEHHGTKDLLLAAGVPDGPAVTGPSGTLTYRQLHDAVHRAAAGYRPGERVLVDDGDPIEVVITTLAAALAGAAAIVVDRRWPPGTRQRALIAAEAGSVVPGDDTWWIGFTSGSAGTPRPIARTARSWSASFGAFGELAGVTAGQRVLVAGSFASSLFLFGALHALWTGAHVIAPGCWEPARLPPSDVAHCVPAMVSDLAMAPQPPGLVICAGAWLPGRVRRQAAERGVRIEEYYGATELSFVAWRKGDGPMLPFPGVAIRLRNGEIWVRSPYLSKGYVAPATGPLCWDDEGYATVGDLGTLGPDGELRLLGRGDAMILTGGAPVLPLDVEGVLTEVPGVRDVVAVGLPHPRLGAIVAGVIEPEPGCEPALSALRAAARAGLSRQQRPRRWYLAAELPRTGSGKPARAAIAAALAAGTLSARSSW